MLLEMKRSFFSWFTEKPVTQRIHLDYASTTPVHTLVYEAMQPYFSLKWANPSAIYKEGVEARKVIETAREELARTLRVRASDITFTSGGTESNNLALVGYVEALHDQGRAYGDMEIISTRVEHPSILETLLYLEKRGVCVTYVSIDTEGKIVLPELETLITPKTVLITFAYANSETGVVQDVKKITRLVRAKNDAYGSVIRTHIDASQAPLWLPCEQDQLGVDMMTLDAGKCCGPKGVGVLTHRHWVSLSPILFGGGQEGGLRSGTENTALIVGCVRALVRAQSVYETRSLAVAKLRDDFLSVLEKTFSNIVLNGSRKDRLANNINISLIGFDSEYAVVYLDTHGVAASTRSACGSGTSTGSIVVREMTQDESRARSTIRFTLGEATTASDTQETVRCLRDYVKLMEGYKVS